MSSPEFQAETRAGSRRAKAVKAGTDLIERGLGILRNVEQSPFNDRAPCFFCGGSGQVMWAPGHFSGCRDCNGTGVFQEDERFLMEPLWATSADNETDG